MSEPTELLPGDIVKHIDGRIGVFANYRDQPEMGGHVYGVFFPEDRKRRSVSQVVYCRFKDLSVIGSIHNRWAAFTPEELAALGKHSAYDVSGLATEIRTELARRQSGEGGAK